MNSAEITFNLCPVLRLAEDTGYAEITSWCIWTLFSGRVWLALPLFEGSYMLDFLYVCMTCFVRGSFWLLQSSIKSVPKRSPSRGGDVMVYAWHKPTELALCFSFCSCVYFCLYGPLNCISFHNFSRQLSVFSLCFSGLISALLVLSTIYISLRKSPLLLI